jgi:hypothetical protein
LQDDQLGLGVEAEYDPLADPRPLPQQLGSNYVPILGLCWSHVEWETAFKPDALRYPVN